MLLVKYLSNVQGAKQYDIGDINDRKNTGVVANLCVKQFSIRKNRKIALFSHLTPKQHIAVAKLVVKKCKVSCTLDGIPVKGLWDTGTQVSMVSKIWLRENLPSSKSRNLEELLGDEAQLNLVGANGGAIPFEGWIEVRGVSAWL